MKEEYIEINQLKDSKQEKERLENYIVSLKQYGTKETNPLRTTLDNWFDEILNSFIFLNGKRISNGPMESKNALLKLIKRNATDIKSSLDLEIVACIA